MCDLNPLAFWYPDKVLYDPRLWAEGNYMPASQFCSVPYRPAVAGPFVRGARQPVRTLLGNPFPCPAPCSGRLPCSPVSWDATACASGRIANGSCT